MAAPVTLEQRIANIQTLRQTGLERLITSQTAAQEVEGFRANSYETRRQLYQLRKTAQAAKEAYEDTVLDLTIATNNYYRANQGNLNPLAEALYPDEPMSQQRYIQSVSRAINSKNTDKKK